MSSTGCTVNEHYEVTDKGIYKMSTTSQDDAIIVSSNCIMPKDTFIEAFSQYIQNDDQHKLPKLKDQIRDFAPEELDYNLSAPIDQPYVHSKDSLSISEPTPVIKAMYDLRSEFYHEHDLQLSRGNEDTAKGIKICMQLIDKHLRNS